MSLPCKRCDRGEEAHHDYEPVVLPSGCVCDPRDWKLGFIVAVCSAFVPMSVVEPELCKTCEHDRECHKENAR